MHGPDDALQSVKVEPPGWWRANARRPLESGPQPSGCNGCDTAGNPRHAHEGAERCDGDHHPRQSEEHHGSVRGGPRSHEPEGEDHRVLEHARIAPCYEFGVDHPKVGCTKVPAQFIPCGFEIGTLARASGHSYGWRTERYSPRTSSRSTSSGPLLRTLLRAAAPDRRRAPRRRTARAAAAASRRPSWTTTSATTRQAAQPPASGCGSTPWTRSARRHDRERPVPDAALGSWRPVHRPASASGRSSGSWIRIGRRVEPSRSHS